VAGRVRSAVSASAALAAARKYPSTPALVKQARQQRAHRFVVVHDQHVEISQLHAPTP
jgi:hypothetical protein